MPSLPGGVYYLRINAGKEVFEGRLPDDQVDLVRMNVDVYRPDMLAVDRNGDPVDADGNVVRQTSPGTCLGTLTGVTLADPTVQSLDTGVDTNTASGGPQTRGEAADVQALIGAPVGASITLQHGDLLVTEQGVSYALWGPRTYGRPNVITGQPLKVNGVQHYWIRGTAVVN